MWPGAGCIIGGAASSENDDYATQPPSIPTYTKAAAIWTPDDAAYHLNQNFRGTEWPTLPDPSFASVVFNLHWSRHGKNGNVRMLPPSRSPNDCDAFTNITGAIGVVNGFMQLSPRKTGLYTWVNSAQFQLKHNIANSITFGTGDLTVEGFQSGAASTGVVWDFRASTSDLTRPSLQNVATNQLALFFNGASILTSSVAWSAGFNHFAWVRQSGVSQLFINGVSGGTVADTNNYPAATNCSIGKDVANGPTTQGIGSAGEWRITVGVARYTGAFTVPSVPFPDY